VVGLIHSDPLYSLLLQLGAGSLIGFLAGYAAKKLAKLIAIGLGLLMLLLMALNYYGVVEVRWIKLIGVGEEALRWISANYSAVVRFAVENMPFAGGFATGLVLGLKAG